MIRRKPMNILMWENVGLPAEFLGFHETQGNAKILQKVKTKR